MVETSKVALPLPPSAKVSAALNATTLPVIDEPGRSSSVLVPPVKVMALARVTPSPESPPVMVPLLVTVRSEPTTPAPPAPFAPLILPAPPAPPFPPLIVPVFTIELAVPVKSSPIPPVPPPPPARGEELKLWPPLPPLPPATVPPLVSVKLLPFTTAP